MSKCYLALENGSRHAPLVLMYVCHASGAAINSGYVLSINPVRLKLSDGLNRHAGMIMNRFGNDVIKLVEGR